MAFSPEKSLLMFDPLLREKFLSLYDLKCPSIDDFSESEKFYETLQGTQHFEDIEGSLHDIHQMSNEEAIEKVIFFMEKANSKLTSDFYDCSNYESKALWLFLNENELFYEIFLWDQLHDYGSQYNFQYKLDSPLDFFSTSKLKQLEDVFKKEFNSKSKGYYCEVKKYHNRETNTLCISVYFSVASHTELGVKSNKMQRIAFRPIKSLHFLIFIEEKKIALQFKRARNKTKADLLKIFLKTTWNEDFNGDEFKTLNLDPFIKPEFKFNIPPEDQHLLEYVRIKALRLDKYIHNKTYRIILDVKGGENPHDIYNLMNSLKITDGSYIVSQATVHFQFRDFGRKGSVTVTLTYPNADTFQDSELHKKCRKYLQLSGIMR